MYRPQHQNESSRKQTDGTGVIPAWRNPYTAINSPIQPLVREGWAKEGEEEEKGIQRGGTLERGRTRLSGYDSRVPRPLKPPSRAAQTSAARTAQVLSRMGERGGELVCMAYSTRTKPCRAKRRV